MPTMKVINTISKDCLKSNVQRGVIIVEVAVHVFEFQGTISLALEPHTEIH